MPARARAGRSSRCCGEAGSPAVTDANLDAGLVLPQPKDARHVVAIMALPSRFAEGFERRGSDSHAKREPKIRVAQRHHELAHHSRDDPRFFETAFGGQNWRGKKRSS